MGIFGLAVGASLTTMAITSAKEALRKEEDKVERFTYAAMQAEEEGNDKKRKYYETLAAHHGERVGEYLEELKQIRRTRVANGNSDDE